MIRFFNSRDVDSYHNGGFRIGLLMFIIRTLIFVIRILYFIMRTSMFYNKDVDDFNDCNCGICFHRLETWAFL